MAVGAGAAELCTIGLNTHGDRISVQQQCSPPLCDGPPGDTLADYRG